MARTLATGANYLDGGSSQYLEALTTASFAFWIYPISNTDGRIVSKWGSSAGNASFWINVIDNDEIDFLAVREGFAQRKSSGANFATSTWAHVVITFTAGNPVAIAFYKNGTSQTVTTVINQQVSSLQGGSGTNLQIGYETNEAVNSTSANIAEFAVWNRILSAEEITGLSVGFSPIFYKNGLLDYVDLIRGDGSGNERSVVNGGSVFTKTGTIAVVDHPKMIYPVLPRIRRWTASAAATGWGRLLAARRNRLIVVQ